MAVASDLIGQVFGRLTIVNRGENLRGSEAVWDCRCQCGKMITTRASRLRSGRTKSCGCLRIEAFKKRIFRHGLIHTKEYEIWKAMKQRCTNPNMIRFSHYGGRGITVCDRWRDSFENFLSDMGPCPEGRSIDRIENNGNYEPSNCRWATAKEQARNKTGLKLSTAKAETIRQLRAEGRTPREIIDSTGMPPSAVEGVLYSGAWA